MQSFDNSYLLSDYAKKQLAKLDKNDPLVTPSKTPTPVNTGQQKRKAYDKAYAQMYREKVKANQDKKAIQRAYEASNPILQEERNAYRESKKTAKKPNTGQHRSRYSTLLTTISDSF